MKKNLLMTAAMTAVLLTGCSNDEEIANIETSAKNAIGFNIVSNRAETKATPIGPSNLTSTDFDVFALNSTTGDIFMGDASGEDGIQIKHNGTGWVYANPSELAYWPTYSLDFYAINPSTQNFAQGTNGYLSYAINSNKQTITYITVDEFHENSGVGKNIDVMYATAKGKTKGSNFGVVELNFKHTLSQVLFNAKVQQASMKVTIKEMKIHNFAVGGTFTFPAENEDPTQNNWEVNKAKTVYTIKENGTDIVVNSTETPVDITDASNPMLFVPQTLTAWVTTAGAPMSKEDADKAENGFQSYLEVICTIEQLGSTVHDGTLYIPFGTEWQPGKRYIYTLNFGGGYDEHGNPILTPITFEPTVENWVDTSGYNVQVK